MQARFLHGNPLMVDYTPGADVSAGDIIVSGDKCYIAHVDIPANTKGSVAAGGGVYEVTATGGSGGDEIAFGDKLYWNAVDEVAEEASSGNEALGWCAAAKAETDTTVQVEHGAF